MQLSKKMENLVAHTDARLSNWYSNAKEDFGVIGNGFSKFNNQTNELEIYYTENGVNYCFKHYYHSDFKLNTIFDIWQTESNTENDKI